MPRYIALFSLACLTRQGAEQLAQRFASAPAFSLRRLQVNLLEGKMLAEFDAPDREALATWLSENRCAADWLLRVEYEFSDGRFISL